MARALNIARNIDSSNTDSIFALILLAVIGFASVSNLNNHTAGDFEAGINNYYSEYAK